MQCVSVVDSTCGAVDLALPRQRAVGAANLMSAHAWPLVKALAVQTGTPGVSAPGSLDADVVEGTLRVQLVSTKDVLVQSQKYTGDVYVQLTCDTLTQYAQCYQTPPLRLAAGSGVFKLAQQVEISDAAAEPGKPHRSRAIGIDFTICKVPKQGIVHLTLFRAAYFGFLPFAYASLHLDSIKDECAGTDMDPLPWLSKRRGGEVVGALTVKAYWSSNEEERKELKLLKLQARLTCTCTVSARSA